MDAGGRGDGWPNLICGEKSSAAVVLVRINPSSVLERCVGKGNRPPPKSWRSESKESSKVFTWSFRSVSLRFGICCFCWFCCCFCCCCGSGCCCGCCCSLDCCCCWPWWCWRSRLSSESWRTTFNQDDMSPSWTGATFLVWVSMPGAVAMEVSFNAVVFVDEYFSPGPAVREMRLRWSIGLLFILKIIIKWIKQSYKATFSLFYYYTILSY